MSEPLTLSAQQAALVNQLIERKIFLEGPAGTGKTAAAIARLLRLLSEGTPAARILVMTPQRTLAAPYHDALSRADLHGFARAGGQVTVLTMGGLARRMIDIFWPKVPEEAGFAWPDRRPTFLTVETAQYHMAHEIGRLIEEKHYFESVTIRRIRLYSQILDNLNKAALVGFPHTEIGKRLTEAWGGESSQRHIYEDAQECASAFRKYCLDHNLLDFSLQIEIFMTYLVHDETCRDYLARTYRHLIVDNVEEDTPTTHDLLEAWLPAFDSALIVYDHEAGYRRFLGADPDNAYALKNLCDTHVAFTGSYVTTDDLGALADQLAASINPRVSPPVIGDVDVRAVLDFAYLRHNEDRDRLYPRYHPEMLDRVADEIANLVHGQGTPPGEIVVLAPFLGDALRFALMNRLEAAGVPYRSHRPSRPLHDEPATRCLLTLAAIAHPAWGVRPTRYDVAYALMQAISGMDLVRAQLLAEIVYRFRDGAPTLAPFDRLKPEMQERITYLLGNRYDGLRRWIEAYIRRNDAPPFDHFLARLFGEMVSQPEYGFHRNYDAAETTASLIESARKFRQAMDAIRTEDAPPLGQAYITMVQSGVIAAQYVRRWQDPAPDDEAGAVLLAPAYTFLMRNRPVTYQFWLNVGSMGWWERLYQPLTHPYVLRRGWPEGVKWTTDHEFKARQDALYRIVQGLIRRCRGKIYLGLSELDEQGNTQQGPLLQAISNVLRRLSAQEAED